MYLCCNCIHYLWCSIFMCFLLIIQCWGFRLGERNNRWTFMLHERAFNSVCLFSDMALGKRQQHKHFTTAGAWGNILCTLVGGVLHKQFSELCFLLRLSLQVFILFIFRGLTSMQDEVTMSACTVRNNVNAPASHQQSNFLDCKRILELNGRIRS